VLRASPSRASKAEVLLNRQAAGGIVKRLKSMFSQMPIREIEE